VYWRGGINVCFRYFTDGRDVRYCNECVCLSAHISQKPYGWTSPNFLRTLTEAVVLFPSSSIVIHYVFRVMWMTSRFHTMGLIVHMYIPKQQEDSPSIKTTALIPMKFCQMKKTRYSSWAAHKACYLWLPRFISLLLLNYSGLGWVPKRCNQNRFFTGRMSFLSPIQQSQSDCNSWWDPIFSHDPTKNSDRSWNKMSNMLMFALFDHCCLDKQRNGQTLCHFCTLLK